MMRIIHGLLALAFQWAKLYRKWAEQRAQENQKVERARLDDLVEKRQEEAFQLAISCILIRIREDGQTFEPWLTQYQWSPWKADETAICFSVNGKSYSLSFQKSGTTSTRSREKGNESDETPVTVNLHDANSQLLYQAGVLQVSYHEGIGCIVLYPGHNRRDIAAFVPGDWVRDFVSVIHNADKRQEDADRQARHSPEALNDMKKKFGL